MSRGFSPPALGAFELFFRPWMRRRLGAIRLAGLPRELDGARPLLLVANHVSWWDGFALREAQRLLRPRAPVHFVMLEAELARHSFLQRIGAIGIDPGSPPSVARAARELEIRVRERPDSVVLFFPQGRIWPSFRRPLGFRRGVEWFARRLAPATVLPLGIHVEPLAGIAPTVWVSAAAPVRVPEGDASAEALQAAVEGELDRVLALLARHGEASPAAWPGPWEPLPPAGRRPAPEEAWG